MISVNHLGENISFFKVFSESDFGNIKTDTEYYTELNGKQLALDIHYTEDGNEDKPVIVYTHGVDEIQEREKII